MAANSKPAKIILKPSSNECCATVTATVSESTVDCNGFPVTFTATETVKRCHENCSTAYQMASTAAQVQAYIHVSIACAVLNDCP